MGSTPSDVYRNRVLTVIAVILGFAALRASYPVAMPLLVTVMTTAAIWPLKRLLDRYLPPAASYALAFLLLLAIVGSFLAAAYYSISQVMSVLDQRWDRIAAFYARVTQWTRQWGLSLEPTLEQERASAIASMAAKAIYSFGSYVGLIAILVALGLPEVSGLWKRMRHEFDSRSRGELYEIMDQSAYRVRNYLSVTLITSLITGLASILLSLMVGLDLALVWGVLNFLLNFIPVVGNIIGIIPPVLYAIVQFDGITIPLITLFGFAAMQLFISNVIYPLLQGRELSIAPVFVVLAMTFWSWMWGLAGALIALPLTTTMLIICEHFQSTRWIAALVSPRRRKAGA
ncbi:AI-2E family transporter [Stakelama saccharophila]|uniref:AI-2E family transporter n=1 Tax=Stakelama saccharophila TaxID=3075605 RepID=A0ABZ0BBP6_9SPHN|nr:AI-2E family transporter [Stakelama sp. W311]WNO54496.1 AI-2E family transporter [Stakelama sp. W311]